MPAEFNLGTLHNYTVVQEFVGIGDPIDTYQFNLDTFSYLSFGKQSFSVISPGRPFDIKLYRDSNNNGVADNDELIGSYADTSPVFLISGNYLLEVSQPRGDRYYSVFLDPDPALLINGTDRSDRLFAGNSTLNYFNAYAGDDTVTGSAGVDYIDGGDGQDTISGRSGDDILMGGKGSDDIRGGKGADKLYGGIGSDYLFGGIGDDILYGGTGIDYLFGDAGDDTLDGGTGIDYLFGDAGDDTLDGGTGSDYLFGWEGNDTLDGGAGIDYLSGWEGNDTLDGGAGSDYLSGGLGDDLYYVDDTEDAIAEDADAGYDSVYSTVSYALSSNLENLYLGGSAAINGTGNDSDNSISGNEAANTLRGESGNDYLYGNSGNDILIGGLGNDTLVGGGGSDSLTGGAGADKFWFWSPTDGIDTIADFSISENDKITISDGFSGGFGGGLIAGTLLASQFRIGAIAIDESDRIIYNSSTGSLSFDVDGIGSQSQVQFATLSPGLLLTNSSFYTISGEIE